MLQFPGATSRFDLSHYCGAAAPRPTSVMVLPSFFRSSPVVLPPNTNQLRSYVCRWAFRPDVRNCSDISIWYPLTSSTIPSDSGRYHSLVYLQRIYNVNSVALMSRAPSRTVIPVIFARVPSLRLEVLWVSIGSTMYYAQPYVCNTHLPSFGLIYRPTYRERLCCPIITSPLFVFAC